MTSTTPPVGQDPEDTSVADPEPVDPDPFDHTVSQDPTWIPPDFSQEVS